MRRKHVPLRTCVACRTRRPQPDLVRIAAGPGAEYTLGPGRQVGGRGAYLCRRIECFRTGLEKGTVDRALRSAGGAEARARLLTWAEQEFAAGMTA